MNTDEDQTNNYPKTERITLYEVIGKTMIFWIRSIVVWTALACSMVIVKIQMLLLHPENLHAFDAALPTIEWLLVAIGIIMAVFVPLKYVFIMFRRQHRNRVDSL